MTTISETISDQCRQAKETVTAMQNLTTETKNTALLAMAAAIQTHQSMIMTENEKDLQMGKKNALSPALCDRLRLTPERLSAIVTSLQQIAQLPDPIGIINNGFTRPNGLRIVQETVPLGVIGIIYEARPNVTADAIGLAIKSGNGLILRGSRSAIYSNQALTQVLTQAAYSNGIPENSIQLLTDTSREGVTTLLTMNDYVDVIIPRGSAALIDRVTHESSIPTIETGAGNCHIYIDVAADLDTALAIIIDAKTDRPSVCNACETVLVHESIAATFLPKAISALMEKGVTIRGCERTQAFGTIEPATTEDWKTEYLDLIVAIRIVTTCNDAVTHINRYSSHHSEAIISTDYTTIHHFTQQIDSATVLVNASTRFTDGSEFGFGTEMGISTQKLHVRGPIGLQHLTSSKYIVYGQGHIRGSKQ